MEWWAFMWIGISFAIFISVLESIHRNAKRKRALQREQELQAQLRTQQYQIYTIQSNGQTTNTNPHGILVHQQSVSVNRTADDLPPKYDELVFTSERTNNIKSTAC